MSCPKNLGSSPSSPRDTARWRMSASKKRNTLQYHEVSEGECGLGRNGTTCSIQKRLSGACLEPGREMRRGTYVEVDLRAASAADKARNRDTQRDTHIQRWARQIFPFLRISVSAVRSSAQTDCLNSPVEVPQKASDVYLRDDEVGHGEDGRQPPEGKVGLHTIR